MKNRTEGREAEVEERGKRAGEDLQGRSRGGRASGREPRVRGYGVLSSGRLERRGREQKGDGRKH